MIENGLQPMYTYILVLTTTFFYIYINEEIYGICVVYFKINM